MRRGRVSETLCVVLKSGNLPFWILLIDSFKITEYFFKT